MTTELEPRIELLAPGTGEIIPIDAPTGTLAQWLDDVREWEGNLREAKKLAQAEIVRRMDADAKWTVHEDGFDLSAPSPQPKREYDPDVLARTLGELVDEELISEAAKDEALELVTSWKPRARGIGALLKRGGDIAERVLACGQDIEPVRRVTIKRRLA